MRLWRTRGYLLLQQGTCEVRVHFVSNVAVVGHHGAIRQIDHSLSSEQLIADVAARRMHFFHHVTRKRETQYSNASQCNTSIVLSRLRKRGPVKTSL